MPEEKRKLLEELLTLTKSERDTTKQKDKTAAGYNEDLKEIRKNIRNVIQEIERLEV